MISRCATAGGGVPSTEQEVEGKEDRRSKTAVHTRLGLLSDAQTETNELSYFLITFVVEICG